MRKPAHHRLKQLMRFEIPLALILVCGFAANSTAHEFWIEPSTFHTSESELIFVRLKAGEHFNGRSQPRNPRNTNSFRIQRNDTIQDVKGQPGDEPAGFILLPGPGLYLLSYHSHPSKLNLDARRFEAYLREEGLESIIQLRADRQQSDELGRERFVRCAKSLIVAGDGGGDGFDTILELPLEVVPERNPQLLHAGDLLSVKILHEGKPLSNALVHARNTFDPANPVSARTDAAGRVEIKLDCHGMWMVSCVCMTEVKDDSDVDWESCWASLTFQIEQGTPPTTKSVP